MSNTTSNDYTPPLYRGHRIPLTTLSAASFEDFIYQVLLLLGKRKDFQMQSGPQPAGDQGFDCTAKTTSGSLVCIQCKRYTGTLYTQTVAEEIIKVALDGALNGSTPKQHYIITCGTVAEKLRKQLRQPNYSDLKDKCKDLLKHADFKSLVKKAKDNAVSPFETIVQYLDSLDNLFVWSGLDFENEISVIWSKLTDILEKHFSLEVAFKEHPRPDFDISNYIDAIDINTAHLVPLQYRQSKLPNKLSYHGGLEDHKERIFSNSDLIDQLKQEKKIIISSQGGSGKSSVLSIIESELVQSNEDIEFLPIKIDLRSYSRNTLSHRIKQKLGINYGSWKSLPFNFIFLFDALDEMLQHDTQAFIDELQKETHGYGFVLTLRDTGLNIETLLNSISFCVSILPLSYRSAFEIARKTLDESTLNNFYNEYRDRLGSIGFDFLSSPFSLNLTFQYYKNNKKIPHKIEELLENWVESKINNDARKITNTSNKINKIPANFIQESFSLILYKSRVEKNLTSISEEKYHEVLMDSYDELESTKSYISRYLNFDEFVAMIPHYEILTLGSDGFYSTPHLIISDYLISKRFSSNWRKHSEKYSINSFQDIWYFSSNYISQKDRIDFTQSILSFNLVLAAEVSKRLGGECLIIAENEILRNEQSEKIITRAQAVSALGILGTDVSLDRLRSNSGFLDVHHSWQRLRSLAAHGDKNVLRKILKEKEKEAQSPVKFSGGSYDIWFAAPPMVLTNIARSRLSNWLLDKTLPLCMCLEIIELYGDIYDTETLLKIINETKVEKELYRAAQAMFSIDCDMLIEHLRETIEKGHHFSYPIKKILLELGIKVNIDEEFNFLIAQSEKQESEISGHSHTFFLDNLVSFLKNFDLTKEQAELLANTYSSLNFNQDLYYYDLLWSLASSMQLEEYIPIAKLAFKNKISDEVHRAINYLSHIDASKVDSEFSKAIDYYYFEIEEECYGTKSYFSKYYLKQGKKSRAYKIISESIARILSETNPGTVTRDEYISCGDLWKINAFLDISIANDLSFPLSISLKFILLDTSTSHNDAKKIKAIILSKINADDIENYLQSITNEIVRFYASAYLLENNLLSNQTKWVKVYLSELLANHMYHSVIEKVFDRIWNDELASFFLRSFLEHKWDRVSAQMIDRLTDFFADKLTKEQLQKFENDRKKPINKLIERIYSIWLEYNDLQCSAP